MRGRLPWLCLAALAGCHRAPAPTPAATGDAWSIEWQGERACADCDAIATRLVLREAARDRRYELTETYSADGVDARFAERGRWGRHAALLRLQGDGGSRRWYALLPDGRLSPRDAHGAPVAGDDALLVPVAGTGP